MPIQIIIKKSDDPFNLPDKTLLCFGYLAEGGTKKFTNPIEFIIDTGATRTTIPLSYLIQSGVQAIEVCGVEESTLADAKQVEMIVGKIDLQLECMRDKRAYLPSIPVNITQTGEVALLGMDILRLFDFHVYKGTLILLQPIEGAFDDYLSALRSQSTNRTTGQKVSLNSIMKTPPISLKRRAVL